MNMSVVSAKSDTVFAEKYTMYLSVNVYTYSFLFISIFVQDVYANTVYAFHFKEK